MRTRYIPQKHRAFDGNGGLTHFTLKDPRLQVHTPAIKVGDREIILLTVNPPVNIGGTLYNGIVLDCTTAAAVEYTKTLDRKFGPITPQPNAQALPHSHADRSTVQRSATTTDTPTGTGDH